MTDSRRADASIRELREFGLIAGALFVALFGLLFPWMRHHAHPIWPFALGGFLIAAGAAYPRILRWPFRGWIFLGAILGWVNSRIILSLLFYLVVTPMGFVMRLLGRDPMNRKREPQTESYRVVSNDAPVTHMERPY